MNLGISRSRIALAVAGALGAVAIATIPDPVGAAKTPGKYVAGDFHNHTTCSDGSISMQKLVKKATDKVETPWGLDWFVQAGHGGSGNRNCTLVEDATLATPAYPVTFSNGSPPVQLGPNTTWANSNPPVTPKGTAQAGGNMWRWQAIQEFQYPLMEYFNKYLEKPLFIGLESVVAGHEHSSMSVISGQIPVALDNATLPSAPPYTRLGNANLLSKWIYCFDAGNGGDQSRGAGNQWDCTNTQNADTIASSNSAALQWDNNGSKKLNTNTGTNGHLKTVEAMKWMAFNDPNGSYYVPAHLERAGPFNPGGNNGYNVEHLRNFNNAAPKTAFGFESQPGHGATNQRGEYTPRRNNFGGTNVDSVGGTTYGGTGVYAGQIGGVWDALLGEGRNWWFFASSDWHSRGSIGSTAISPDDRRTTGDFFPGEYQRTYAMVRNGSDKLRPPTIVNGLRSGNVFAATGQLIDRLAFIACVAPATYLGRTGAAAEALFNNAVQERAVALARNNTDGEYAGCAFMGEKLKVEPGADIVVAIVVRDPAGTNFSPYTFPNPSLLQVGITQPINQPVLDHVDVIQGLVTGYKDPVLPQQYAGEWPRDWMTLKSNPNVAVLKTLNDVPEAAKNTSAHLLTTFNSGAWQTVPGDSQFKKMVFRIKGVNASQYVRLRGTNLPPATDWETDIDGNPLPDLYTNAAAIAARVPGAQGTLDSFTANAFLKIECTTVGTDNFNGCPAHLPVVNGKKMVAFDVAAWSDLWFYSNPIYVEVNGSTAIAGVQ